MKTFESKTDLHPIGVAIRRTGLTPDLIRVWERRYGAVAPRRSEGGHRLYSETEIRRLALLRDATRLGHPIRRLADVGNDELEELIRRETESSPREGVREPAAAPESSVAGASDRVDRCLRAVRDLDGPALSEELDRASFALGGKAMVDELLAPLMERIGDGWAHGEISPAHEHFASAAIRSLVGRFLIPSTHGAGPALIVTTPQGQSHELGALVAAATAAAAAWRVIYLGPDLPAEAIAGVVEAVRGVAGTVAVALSITYRDSSSLVVKEVSDLVARLSGIPVLLGGRAARSVAATVGGTVLVENLHGLRRVLAGLESG